MISRLFICLIAGFFVAMGLRNVLSTLLHFDDKENFWSSYIACFVATFILLFLVSYSVFPEKESYSYVSNGNSSVSSVSSFNQKTFSDNSVGINWHNTPKSTCFSRIGYDKKNETLGVTFRETGKTYYYYNFSSSNWNSFNNADSLGSYFNKYIKGYYSYKKIN